MVGHGRALAVAAAWIIVPLTAAAVALCAAFPSREGWNAMVPALAFAGVVLLTPVALLAAAIWIARRSSRARSAAALGAQAGLIGVIVAALAMGGFVAVNGN